MAAVTRPGIGVRGCCSGAGSPDRRSLPIGRPFDASVLALGLQNGPERRASLRWNESKFLSLVELIIYKGFGHGISKPKERLAAVWHNWRFFAEWVWGETVEIPTP